MKITRLAILITLTFSVLKSQATEFNASLLDSGNLSNVDLTAFSREGYVAPGNYILDIWLNDQPVREQYPVRVVPVAGLDAAVICVTTDMVAMLGLKDKIIHGLKPVTGIPDGQCLELRSADSQVRYSAENQRLTFIIPQAWMRYQDPDWVPPSRWSDGVTAGLLDYSLMVNRYMPQQGETSTSYSLYGTAGFNLGAWRLRSDYQYSRFDSGQGASQSDFYLPQTYLFRALPALRSSDRRTSAPLFLTPSALPGSLWPAMSACCRPLFRGMPRKLAALRTVMHRSPSARMVAFCTRPGCRRGLLSFPT